MYEVRESILESAREGRLQPTLEMTLARLRLELDTIERVLSGEVGLEFDNIEGASFFGGKTENARDLFVKYNFSKTSPGKSPKYRVFLEMIKQNKETLIDFYEGIEREVQGERRRNNDRGMC